MTNEEDQFKANAYKGNHVEADEVLREHQMHNDNAIVGYLTFLQPGREKGATQRKYAVYRNKLLNFWDSKDAFDIGANPVLSRCLNMSEYTTSLRSLDHGERFELLLIPSDETILPWTLYLYSESEANAWIGLCY